MKAVYNFSNLETLSFVRVLILIDISKMQIICVGWCSKITLNYASIMSDTILYKKNLGTSQTKAKLKKLRNAWKSIAEVN